MDNMEAPTRTRPNNRLYLVIVLIIATAATLLSTVLTYRNALTAAESSLKLQALGIAVSLEVSLRNAEEDQTANLDRGQNIFKDIIMQGGWEGIAFISLHDRTGFVLLHSNENLIGKQVIDSTLKKAADSGDPLYHHLSLGTGEDVFVLDFPLHIRNAVRVLRLALHTYPAQRITRQARLQIIVSSVVIVVLWIVGFFFIRAAARSEKLERKMVEKEKLVMLGEMASVLAHEIRNPLGSIKGFAQYLREQRAGGASASEDQKCLDIIIEESGRLETLTEDLLLYARPSEIRAGEFNLRDLVEETLKGLPFEEEDIRTEVSIPADILIISDRDKLRQILINILQNAIDAMPSGGRVEIGAGRLLNSVLITIRDNGCGMDPTAKAKAFDPFFTSKTRGTGLGLPIVEKLALCLNARIEIESGPGKGTTFRLTLPGPETSSGSRRIV